MLYHLMSEKVKVHGETYSAETWHRYAKSKFLGCEEFRLPNGKTYIEARSTAALDKQEFSDYMTQVELLANGFDCYLEDEVFA